MAEHISCDRCGKTVNGRISPPEYTYQGLQANVPITTTKPGGPSVAGWEIVRGGKLFCPGCVAALDRFCSESISRCADG